MKIVIIPSGQLYYQDFPFQATINMENFSSQSKGLQPNFKLQSQHYFSYLNLIPFEKVFHCILKREKVNYSDKPYLRLQIRNHKADAKAKKPIPKVIAPAVRKQVK